MKKKIVGILLCSAMLLTACGGKNAAAAETTETTEAAAEDTTEADQAEEEAAEETETASEEGTVTPLVSEINTDDLADGTYAVSFESKDESMDNGAFKITMTVYDYEHFDAAAVENLKAGDTLVIDGKDMVVDTVESNETGMISINGGLEEGGCDLGKDEDGNYSELLMDIGKSYFAVGEVTLPVSQEFVFTDNSDPENQGVEYYAGDMITLLESGDNQIFSELSTTATVKDGELTELTRIFMP